MSSDQEYYQYKNLHAIIFNHIEFAPELQLERRDGAEKDAALLESTLQQFNFTVETHTDLTHQEICLMLGDIVKRLKHTSTLVFTFVMSHGYHGKIAARDKCYTPKMFHLFLGSSIGRASHEYKSRTSMDFPNVLFLQACQPVEDPNFSATWSCLPTFHDNLIVYATTPGSLATRETLQGSWLITYLCMLLNSISPGECLEISTLIPLLHEMIHSKARDLKIHQIPFSCSTLRKKLKVVKKLDAVKLTDLQLLEGGVLTTDAKGNVTYVDTTAYASVEDIAKRGKPLEYLNLEKPHNGVALIATNTVHRESVNPITEKMNTEIDRFSKLLPKFGFDDSNIHTMFNTSASNIHEKLAEIRSTASLVKPACLLVVILCEGLDKNPLQLGGGLDAAKISEKLDILSDSLKLNQLWAPFRGEILKGIPKIFIIDADCCLYTPDLEQQDQPKTPYHDADFMFVLGRASSVSWHNKRYTKERTFYSSLVSEALEKCEEGKINVTDVLVNYQDDADNVMYFPSPPVQEISTVNSTLTRVLNFYVCK